MRCESKRLLVVFVLGLGFTLGLLGLLGHGRPTTASSPADAAGRAAAGFPFYDSFESGTLGPSWTVFTTSQGRVRVDSAYPYSGTYSLLLDDSVDDSTDSYAAAILSVDLAGQSDVGLTFWWRDFGDEDHAADGVFFSDDGGATWVTATNFVGDHTGFVPASISVDAVAASHGLTLSDTFQIKFQFYDDYSIDSDGYAIDEVRLERIFVHHLPIVMTRWPPIPDTPVLNPIGNSDGDGYYTVDWDAADLATTYSLQEDDNSNFSSPVTRYSGSSTSWYASGKGTGTYYYRVRSNNSWGSSGWSATRSVTVQPPRSRVYVQNDTGGDLCYEVHNTGVGRRCFSSGTHFYGEFPVGTYSWSASAWCGSASGSRYYSTGSWTHQFWCGFGAAPNWTLSPGGPEE